MHGVELSSLNRALGYEQETGLGSYGLYGTFTPSALMLWEDEGRACQGWGRAFCGASQGQWPLGLELLGCGLPGRRVDLYQGGAYHYHVAQFVGQMLQAVLGHLEGSQGAFQLLVDVVAPPLLSLECLLHRVAELPLAAGSQAVQQLQAADSRAPQASLSHLRLT